MITDKDLIYQIALLFSPSKVSDGNTYGYAERTALALLNEHDDSIRTESAEQARKEAAERAVDFVDQFDEDSQDGDFWTSADLRAIILNSPVKEGKTDAEKLAIAVKALKSIYEMLKCDGGDSWKVADHALKEIE